MKTLESQVREMNHVCSEHSQEQEDGQPPQVQRELNSKATYHRAKERQGMSSRRSQEPSGNVIRMVLMKTTATTPCSHL